MSNPIRATSVPVSAFRGSRPLKVGCGFLGILLASGFWLLASPDNAHAANWYVNDTATASDSFTYAGGSDTGGIGSPSLPLRTLQMAVDSAAPGDTIFVDAGTYDSYVTVNSTETVGVNIKKDLITIVGKDSASTVIDPPGPGSQVGLYGIYADTQAGLSIRNLGVTGAFIGIYLYNVDTSLVRGDSVSATGADVTSFVGGILLRDGSDSNTIDGVTADSNVVRGISMDSCQFNTVKNCLVTRNGSQSGGAGIVLHASCRSNVIYGNTCNSNQEAGIGIVDNSYNNMVRNNLLKSNIQSGFVIMTSETNSIYQNQITNSDTGVLIGLAAFNNFISKNNIHDNNVKNIFNQFGNPAILTRNFFNGSANTNDTIALKAKISDTVNAWVPYRSDPIDTADGADTVAPKAPDTVAVVKADTDIVLQWSTPTANEDGNAGSVGLAGYTVFRGEVKDTSNWIEVASNVTVNRWEDTNVVLGRAYYYRVDAFDTPTPNTIFDNSSFFSDTQAVDSPVFSSTVNWYVNDTATAGDSFTFAAGSDTASGKGTTSAPFKTITRAMQFATVGDTVFVDAGTYDSFVIVSSTETAGVVINVDSLTIQGKDSNATIIDPPGSTGVTGLYGLYATARTGLIVKNLAATGAREGLYFTNVDRSTINGDSFCASGDVGIYLLSGSDTNTISSCAANNSTYGIWLASSHGNTVTLNTTITCGTIAIELQGANGNTLSNNAVNSNSNRGINIESASKNNSVTGNTANNNTNFGFYIIGATQNTLTNNTANSSVTGFRFESGADSNTLESCTALTHSSYGVYLFTNSNANLVRNNLVKSNTVSGVRIEGSNGNVIVQNDIIANDTGVEIVASAANNTVSKNNLTGNTTHAIGNRGGLVQTLTRNWYGTTDESVIAAKVKDTASAFSPYRLGLIDTTPGADSTAPLPPANVTLDTATDGVILLTWTIPTINEETNGGAVSYNGAKIYRTTVADTNNWANSANLVRTTSSTETTWTDTTVAVGGKIYYYRLTSLDAATPVTNQSFFTDTKSAEPRSKGSVRVYEDTAVTDEVDTYVTRDQMAIEVRDTDENRNSAAIDTVTVTVYVGNGAGEGLDTKGLVIDTEIIVLTEINADSGIFRISSVNLTDTVKPVIGDGYVSWGRGDTIQVVYSDANDPTDSASDTALALEIATAARVIFYEDAAFGDDVDTYLTRDVMRVAVHDTDENRNPEFKDTVAVTIYVGNGFAEGADAMGLVLDTQSLVLTESAETTGIFQSAAIPLIDTEAPAVENGRISWGRSDTIHVAYTDITGTSESASDTALALEISSSSVTTIYEDTVFTDDVDTLLTRDLMFLQVSDTDENRNPQLKDTVTVIVYVGNGAGGGGAAGLVLDTETKILTESTQTSGIFRGDTLIVTDTALPVVGDGIVSWGLSDTILVQYTDVTGVAESTNDTALALEIKTNAVVQFYEDANYIDDVDTFSTANDKMFLQVQDTDENRNPQSIETVTVTVYIGNDTNGIVIDTEFLILTEAGETSGIFRSGGINIVDTDAEGLANNGRLSGRRSDTIHVSYTDANDAPDVRSDTALLLGLSVSLINPANGAETTTATIRFEWSGTSVDSYSWYLSKTSTFSSIADSVIDTSATSMIRTLTLGEDTFFWRVVGRNAASNGYDTSAPRGFIIDTSANQVVVSQPADGHETTAINLVVSWTAVVDSVGVDSYAVDVSKNASFTSLMFADTVDATRLSDTVTGLYNDSYYWRVRAIDNRGNGGPYSATRGFVTDTIVNAVTLSQPSDGHETTAINILVSWSALADSVGIDSYMLEVSKNTGFTSMVFADTVDGARLNDTVTGLYNDSYYWRIRAIDNRGNGGPYSAARGFVTDTIVNQTTLSLPADGHETTAINFRVAWNVTFDSVGVDSYALEVSKNTVFTSLVFTDTVDGATSSPGDTVTGLYNDTYYWRVRAIDNRGNGGPYSLGAGGAPRGFVTDTIVNQPTLVNPSDGHETTVTSVKLSWNSPVDSVGIDSHAVEVSKNTAFTNMVFTDTVDVTVTSDTATGLYNDTYYWRVRSIDNRGNKGPYSAARGFVTDTIVNQTTLSLPADGHETTAINILVSWISPVDSVGIDSHALEVSKNTAFTSMVFTDTVDVTVTSDTVTGLYNDSYYWRVRAIDNRGNQGAYSASRGFVTDTIIGKVVLSSPATNSILTDSTPQLFWAALADSVGVDSYVFQISRDSAFATVLFTDTRDGAITDTTSNELTGDTTYYWRVRAIDNRGNVGAFSDSFAFKVDTTPVMVTLLNPSAGAETTAATIRFQWSVSASVDTLTWQLSKSSTFATLIDSVVDTVSSTTQLTRTMPGQDTFYWRVIGRSALGAFDTQTRGFVVDTVVNQVTLSLPADGHETTAINILASWNILSDSVGIDSYMLEVSKNTAFTNMTFTDTIDGARTNDTVTGLYNDTYYWRVRAIDNRGNAGSYSATRGFITDTIVNQVALVNPADGHETTAINLLVSWVATADSVGVDSYGLEVSKNTAFTSLVFTDTVDGTRLSDTVTGLYNDSYYWRVRAIDNRGNGGLYSVTRGFVTDTIVSQVTLSLPADGHETTAINFQVRWTSPVDSVGIDSHALEVSKNTGFTSMVFTDTVDVTVTADTVTGLNNDSYYWRVRAIDNRGNGGPYSATRGFVTDTIVNQVALSTPVDGTQTNVATPNLIWTALADSVGIDSYTLEVSNTIGFGAIVFTNTLDGVNTNSVVTGLYNDTYFWRVRAIDELGNAGVNSATRGFVQDTFVAQVTLSAPADGHETTAINFQVSWNSQSDSVGLDSYALEVSRTSGFTATVFTDTVDVTRTSDTVTGLYNDTYYWRVRAIDYLGNVGANSAARGFVTDTIVNQTTLSLPANGHETTAINFLVSWNTLPDSVGIDSYMLEVSKNTAFTNMIFTDTVDGPRTNDTVTGLYNDSYYWRVRAVDNRGNAGSYSAARGFITDTIVAKVTLTLPANNTVTTDTTPTLTWLAVSDSVGIDSYVIEISKDSSFNQFLYADTRDGSFTDSTTRELVGDTIYYWRVKAIDNRGNAGAYSDSFAFKVDTSFGVTLTLPGVAHETTNATIAFTWSGANIDTYTWQISKSATFATILAQQTFDTATDTTFKLPNQDTFFWRVIGISTAVTGALTDTTPARTILLDTQTAQVTLAAPPDATETTALSVPVRWNALDDSAGIDSYVVEASKSAGFTSTIFADTVDGPLTTDFITGTYNDTYFWRVRAIDDLGNAGANSAVRGFVVDTSVNTVSLLLPADGHETNVAVSVLSWSAVSDSVGIDSYVLETSKSGAFAVLYSIDTVDGAITSRTVTGLYNDTYFWRVRAIDNRGNISLNSAVRGFIVDTLVSQVTVVGPADGHETTISKVVVTWSAVVDSVGIDSYAVEACTSTAFTSLTFSDTIDGSRTNDTIANLYIDTYFWRVRAIDNRGNGGAYSATRGFRSDTNVRFGTVQLLTPAGSVASTAKAKTAGDSLMIEVNDTDPNANTGAQENASVWIENVTFNSSGGAEVETITVKEVGVNSGIFRETVTLSALAADSGVNGKLFVRPGDAIRVNYLDSPRLIVVTSSATVEAGGVAGDSVVFDTGNHAVRAAGGTLIFKLAVYDTAGDTVSNTSVSYDVEYNGSNAAGGATFSPAASTTTGSSGFTPSITLTLGSGNGVYVVTATTVNAKKSQIVVYTDKRDIPASKWTMVGPFRQPDASLTGLSQFTFNGSSAASFGGTVLSYYYDPTLSADGSNANGNFYKYKSVTGQASPNNSPNGDFTGYDSGKGYWFKTSVAAAVGLAGNATIQTDTAKFYVSVPSGGSPVMIANPFMYFIDWMDDVYIDTDPSDTVQIIPVKKLNSTSPIDTKLQWRSMSAEQNVVPIIANSASGASETTVQLKPWAAAWVRVNSSCTVVFSNQNKRIPKSDLVAAMAPAYTPPSEGGAGGGDASSWRLQLMAYTGVSEIRDEYNFVGVAPLASNAEDMNDIWKAPGVPGDVQVWIGEASSPESPAAGAGKFYGTSIGAPVKTAASWPVIVTGPTGPVTLKWDVSRVPAEYGAILLGGPSGPVDMRTASSASVVLASSAKLTLAVGLPDYLAAFLAAPLSKDNTFVYPNPGPDAAGVVTFKYNLQAPGDVTLKIFDVGGKLVKELKESGLAGGNTTLKWDTTNKNGQKLGSGVYIYILESGGAKLVDKLAIVR